MAIRRIRKEGDPVLRTVCKPVTQFDESLWRLLDDMQNLERCWRRWSGSTAGWHSKAAVYYGLGSAADD